jgi:hypothetical protein
VDVRSADPQPAVRRARAALFLAGSAVIMAIALPAAGLILGIAALVTAIRARGAPRLRWLGMTPSALAYVGAGLAIIVGGLLTAASLLIGDELAQLRECQAGANTRVAEERCQDEFNEAISSRFGIRL